MSNFTFLKTDWPELYETAREAEQNVASTPLSHRALILRATQSANLKQPYADNLAASISPIFHLQISTTNKILTA
jgi:hypothetical protein